MKLPFISLVVHLQSCARTVDGFLHLVGLWPVRTSGQGPVVRFTSYNIQSFTWKTTRIIINYCWPRLVPHGSSRPFFCISISAMSKLVLRPKVRRKLSPCEFLMNKPQCANAWAANKTHALGIAAQREDVRTRGEWDASVGNLSALSSIGHHSVHLSSLPALNAR